MFARILLSLVLAALILLPCSGWAVATEIAVSENTKFIIPAKSASGDIQTAVSQEDAVRITRMFFPELLEGKELQAEPDEYMIPGQRAWRLSWNSRNPAPFGREGYIHILIDAQTGDLLNADFSIELGKPVSDVSLISRDEAKKKAAAFAKKMRPDEFARTRLDEKQPPGYYGAPGIMTLTYNFYWQRYVNDIAVEGDGITIGVDTLSGQIQHYSFRWRKGADFPQPGQIREAGDLARRILTDMGLYLGYGVREDAGVGPQGLPEAFLFYRLNTNGTVFFDPRSGEPLDYTGKKIPQEKARRFAQLPVPQTNFAGADPLEAPKVKIGETEALKAAQDFFRRIGVDEMITRSGGGSGGEGIFRDEYRNYSPQADRETERHPRRDLRVMVNTLTGEVDKYFNNGFQEGGGLPSAGGKSPLSREQALARAMAFIKLVNPEGLAQVTLAGDMIWREQKDSNYSFQFIRLVNGLPFWRDGIQMNVDAVSGEITEYDCSWHRAYFPDLMKALNAEEAGDLFLEKIPFTLAYFYPWEEGKESSAPVLSYHFAGFGEMGLDAVSGELLYSDWRAARPVNQDKPAVPREHWAALPLALLAESGLLPAGESFDPDTTVTRRGAVRVLISAMNRYYESGSEENPAFSDIGRGDHDYTAIQMAVWLGILKGGGEFKPDEPLSRETMAGWLVGALGHEEVAGMPIKIELTVKDANLVDVSLYNHVAIACGLGLLAGDDSGFFRPRDNLTWAELATVASKAAPHLRNRFSRW